MHRIIRISLALVLFGFAGTAAPVLPPPTPAQVQAQAAKKAIADAQAESVKQHLLAKMDALSGAWRIKAGEQGWPLHAATALAAPAAALAAPASMTGASTSGVPTTGASTTGAAVTGASGQSNSTSESKIGAVPVPAQTMVEKKSGAAPRADPKVVPAPPPASVKQ